MSISIIHYLISVWLSTKSFAHAFHYFDTGKELKIMQIINYWLVEMLFFPIVTIFENSNYVGTSGVASQIPFILNSMLWGVFIVFVCRLIINRNK